MLESGALACMYGVSAHETVMAVFKNDIERVFESGYTTCNFASDNIKNETEQSFQGHQLLAMYPKHAFLVASTGTP